MALAIVYQLLLVNGVDYLLWPVDSIICLHYIAVGSAFATTELVCSFDRSDGVGRICTKDCGRGAGGKEEGGKCRRRFRMSAMCMSDVRVIDRNEAKQKKKVSDFNSIRPPALLQPQMMVCNR
eukprot:scaffold9508_cov169-Skeletonema_menzelii.AAC.4